MKNGKSLFLQAKQNKKNLTIADTIMITLNNFEMNLLKIQKIKTFSELNDGIQGREKQIGFFKKGKESRIEKSLFVTTPFVI